MGRVKKYLVTRIDGCTLEIDTFFLNSNSETNIKNWISEQLGDEVEITTRHGSIYGRIPCDYQDMLKDTQIWVEPVEVIVNMTL